VGKLTFAQARRERGASPQSLNALTLPVAAVCAPRMTDSAALLADEVLPAQPVRQWVLSLPFALRFCGALSFVRRTITGERRKRANAPTRDFLHAYRVWSFIDLKSAAKGTYLLTTSRKDSHEQDTRLSSVSGAISPR